MHESHDFWTIGQALAEDLDYAHIVTEKCDALSAPFAIPEETWDDRGTVRIVPKTFGKPWPLVEPTEANDRCSISNQLEGGGYLGSGVVEKRDAIPIIEQCQQKAQIEAITVIEGCHVA